MGTDRPPRVFLATGYSKPWTRTLPRTRRPSRRHEPSDERSAETTKRLGSLPPKDGGSGAEWSLHSAAPRAHTLLVTLP